MKTATTLSASSRPLHQSGVSLIELMVALTIGLVLIAGALAVFLESRETAQVNRTLARLQENAMYAANELSTSLELAGYLGANNSPHLVVGRTERTDGAITKASTLNAATNNCTAADGYEWYTDIERPIEGLDASGTDSANDASSYASCIPDSEYLPGTDILIVRYVEPEPNVIPTASLEANNVYVRSDPGGAVMFVGDTEPGGLGPDAQNYRYRAYAYYVSDYFETAGDGIPTLKRARLDDDAGGVRIIPGATGEQEVVIAGIENLQVQYGVDRDGNGSADSYLDAVNVAGNQWNNVVSVRLWVLARAEEDEQRYANDSVYTLPQEEFDPGGDKFRRLLFTKTVNVRNNTAP